MNRLKILFLPAGYPTENNPAGGIFIRELAKAVAIYNDVTVLYAYPSHLSSCIYGSIAKEIDEEIETIRVRYGGRILDLWERLRNRHDIFDSYTTSHTASFGLLNRRHLLNDFLYFGIPYIFNIIAAFLRIYRRKPDIDVIHAHGFYAAVPAVLIGQLYDIPVIISEYWSGFIQGNLTVIDRWKAKFSMNHASIILPVSDPLKSSIKSIGIKNEFKVFPNTVDTKMFHPPATRKKRSKKKSILFVGRLIPSKGLSTLLSAITEISKHRSDFILNIIGDGPIRSEFEAIANELRISERVLFHGTQRKEIVALKMQESDFLVQPSLLETFGITVIEAIASGIPVVASDVGCASEILRERNDLGLLVPPGDVHALAEALNRMLDDNHNYSAEILAQYASSRYGHEIIGRRIDEVYRTVVPHIQYD